ALRAGVGARRAVAAAPAGSHRVGDADARTEPEPPALRPGRPNLVRTGAGEAWLAGRGHPGVPAGNRGGTNDAARAQTASARMGGPGRKGTARSAEVRTTAIGRIRRSKLIPGRHRFPV